MKVLVINGTEKRGVTYRLKETFLSLIKVNTRSNRILSSERLSKFLYWLYKLLYERRKNL